MAEIPPGNPAFLCPERIQFKVNSEYNHEPLKIPPSFPAEDLYVFHLVASVIKSLQFSALSAAYRRLIKHTAELGVLECGYRSRKL